MNFARNQFYLFEGQILNFEKETPCYVFFKERKFLKGSKNYKKITLRNEDLKLTIEGLKKENRKLRQKQAKVKEFEKLKEEHGRLKRKIETIHNFERVLDYLNKNNVSVSDILHRNLVYDKRQRFSKFYEKKHARNKVAHPRITDPIKNDSEFLKIISNV